MGRPLLLYRDATNESFTLAQEGNELRHTFTDLRDALSHAAAMVTEETPIRVYNEMGKLVVESAITPHTQRAVP
jgi:hypothetical protein